ncbi:C40 family peptidase [Ovoidimarina sediminis]|uniref:C40 family peptidase n=1 Tax=Ovoidimarina sediminis TaxID=3079856 RepID=UPI00290FEAE0|nr:NlpC/P60 family protein [Rhodophyticola sp. MJ-SS7]MDU8944480.1 NlpC/P60 family protein [Rhodophyticola sp. MJ-SS7]
MSDPRQTPFDGRVAHRSLEGQVEAEAFTDGRWAVVTAPRLPLFSRPSSGMERELLMGDRFCVIAEPEGSGGLAYGFAARDGYCGYVSGADLAPARPATHWVAVRETYRKATPDLKAFDLIGSLSFGSRLTVSGTEGAWARIAGAGGDLFHVPAAHLRPIGSYFDDPVAVACLFMGTPYLWGGNSGNGIDCSGLVQAAMLACAIPCPGDSDQQRAGLGEELVDDAPRERGDLYFWAGHVGLLCDPDTLLHANAHHMAVAEEPLDQAIERIAAKEGKPVLKRRRITLPPE